MDVLDYVLDGLEAALELERELGVRSVEIDRSLLTGAASKVSRLASSPGEDARRETEDARRETGDARRETAVNRTVEQSNNRTISGIVFLHDRPLSPGGVEMMAKIIAALGLTAETAPIVVAPPLPRAKIAVVLGGRALKRYFPDVKGGPGMWIKRPEGQEILITYSPEYILRFATVTPAVEKIKKDMWRSLKAVKQRFVA